MRMLVGEDVNTCSRRGGEVERRRGKRKKIQVVIMSVKSVEDWIGEMRIAS